MKEKQPRPPGTKTKNYNFHDEILERVQDFRHRHQYASERDAWEALATLWLDAEVANRTAHNSPPAKKKS